MKHEAFACHSERQRGPVLNAVKESHVNGAYYYQGYGYGDNSYYGHEQPKELTDKHGKGASTGGIAASTGKG